MMYWSKIGAALALILPLSRLDAADYPAAAEADYTLRNFQFASGKALPELRIHYRTLGKPERDAKGVVRNAVLILHGTTGNGGNFLRPEFAGELFGAGGLLDAGRHYIILPDGIGHGKSSKPSDGLHARFPKYGYRDMISAQHRLLVEGLRVDHLRLILGTSMGGMHTWLWGEQYPDFADALAPLASLPIQISGRNRFWRRLIVDAIRTDPDWNEGEYKVQPHGLRIAAEMLNFMSGSAVTRQRAAPTLKDADRVLDAFTTNAYRTMDANDVLYALDASRDYEPAKDLEKIQAPLLAINFADDLINPPELGVLEREIRRVRRGRALVIPAGPKSVGHGTHTIAAVWKQYLAELLRESAHH